MLKIRMQGTLKDIAWFMRLLERYEGIKVLQASKPFANKGTNKYFRVYSEVEKEQN